MDDDKSSSLIPTLIEEFNITNAAYDAILLVTIPKLPLKTAEKLAPTVQEALKYDSGLDSEVSVLPLPDFAAGRLIYAPTGPVDPDYDDVRILKQTAAKGVKRALKAGSRKLLVVLEEFPNFEDPQLVILLGILEALYVPIQHRERDSYKGHKLDVIGVLTNNEKKTKDLVRLAKILEKGLIVARDIGGADPERMTPPRVQKYVEETFSKTSIDITVISDPVILAKEYPLFDAVNRAASGVERHRGRIMYLEYNPPSGVVKETLMIAGKGVTYDTGGADIKAGGAMIGMSRDKCGAAAVAGFMKIVDAVKPPHTKIITALSLVRNSVGSNAYVSDEIILSRSNLSVRIGNTDAEGRMILGDILCRFKEMAVNAVSPQIFSIATLTGHAVLTAGLGYSIAIDNGPAHRAGTASKLQKNGEMLADPFEVSRMRREDIAFHKGQAEGDDLLQANSKPSSQTPRGHQGPAAFLLMVSGLDKHGSGTAKPLKYSHLDIAASAGAVPQIATGASVLALAKTFLLQ